MPTLTDSATANFFQIMHRRLGFSARLFSTSLMWQVYVFLLSCCTLRTRPHHLKPSGILTAEARRGPCPTVARPSSACPQEAGLVPALDLLRLPLLCVPAP